MFNLKFFFIGLLLSNILLAQKVDPVLPFNGQLPPRWSYDAFSYADFGTGEQHSYFFLLYKIDPKFQLELQTFYDTYLIADVLDVSARVKWYPVKKVYMFSGVGLQIQRRKGFGELPIVPIRMLNGFGYEPNSDTTIEAVYDMNLGATGGPDPLRLGGKYRF